MANLLQFKINVRISHLEPRCTYNSCTKIACCSSELIFMFLYDHSSIQTAGEQFISCIHLSFVSFALHPTPQTLSLPKMITFLPESTYIYIYIYIYICVCVCVCVFCVCMYVLFENLLDFSHYEFKMCHMTLNNFKISLNILHLAIYVYFGWSSHTTEPRSRRMCDSVDGEAVRIWPGKSTCRHVCRTV